MAAYYNEIEPFAAAWLRELIARNLIAPGDVDERSIEIVQPQDLAGYDQCHFFAGIGVWSYALRSAGWPDDRPVWTGSCPCQPFSAAGKGDGFADARHLWPAWFRLIRERQPAVVFGEQVAALAGLAWLDIVSTDLEAEGYAVGSADLCAAGLGAPHRRQRLWFVADAERERGRGGESRREDAGDAGQPGQARDYVGDAASEGLPQWPGGAVPRGEARGVAERPSHTRGFWGAAEWLPCTDGRSRPVEPGSFPLAHGAPARVGRLRGYGNAIVAPVAQAFIEAYLDVRGAA